MSKFALFLAATVLSLSAVAAQADPKFSGVAPRSEHRSYQHERYAHDHRRRAHRHDAYCPHRHRNRGHRSDYRSRHWRDYDRYDRRYRQHPHYRRHHNYRRHGRYYQGRHGYGVRLGDGIYLTPDGLILRLDFDD